MTSESNQLIETFKENLLQCMNKLQVEIRSYPNDWALWIKEGGAKCPGGELCMVVANAVGQTLSLIEGRAWSDFKFETQHPTRKELLVNLETAKALAVITLSKLSSKDLNRKPLNHDGLISTFLVKMLADLSFATGQISYHRKLI